MGVASEWNLWVWLECMGVVSVCCKEVYRFLHNITYPYSTCTSSLFATAFLLLCLIFLMCLFLNEQVAYKSEVAGPKNGAQK